MPDSDGVDADDGGDAQPLPERYVERPTGRARMVRAMPDSSSPAMTGAAMKTALRARMKLNMKVTRMSSCA